MVCSFEKVAHRSDGVHLLHVLAILVLPCIATVSGCVGHGLSAGAPTSGTKKAFHPGAMEGSDGDAGFSVPCHVVWKLKMIG